MPFEWTKFGGPPAPDEFEVCVFGPGFGECIVVHVGSGRWVIVDSCIDSEDSTDDRPVAERYLRQIGVSIETSVDMIVATHWHDDHIRGLGRLVEVCKSAKFCCAKTLLNVEFIAFVTQMATGSVATHGAKLREFSKIFKALQQNGRTAKYASGSRILMSWLLADNEKNGSCRLLSLSPSDRDFELFTQMIVDMQPKPNSPKRSASSRNENLNSVVLHLSLADCSILLGADMEVHHEQERGWNSVLTEAANSTVTPSSIYKVAHHGSVTGHHEEIWSALLHPRPICLVTPFNRLPESKKLPTEVDIDRLLGKGRLILTSPRSSKKSKQRDPAVVRSLRESQIVIRELTSAIGMTRLRRKANSVQHWNLEIFPPAQELISSPK